MTEMLIMRECLLKELHKEMMLNEKLMLLSGDFGSPVIDEIISDFPDQFINVGISEQNLINVSSGLSLEGYTIFAYGIAPFLTMRCFEQIRINLALLSNVRNINVNLIGVGAGYSYVVSGPTHQCYEDISIIRSLQNIEIFSPSDGIIAGKLLNYCINKNGPKYLRLDAQPLPKIYDRYSFNLKDGFNELFRANKICIVSTGYMTHTAIEVNKILSKNNISVGIIDVIAISNFNLSKLISILCKYSTIYTLEEGFVNIGGLDVIISNMLQDKSYMKIKKFGIKNGYKFQIGTRNEIHELERLDPKYIAEDVQKEIQG